MISGVEPYAHVLGFVLHRQEIFKPFLTAKSKIGKLVAFSRIFKNVEKTIWCVFFTLRFVLTTQSFADCNGLTNMAFYDSFLHISESTNILTLNLHTSILTSVSWCAPPWVLPHAKRLLSVSQIASFKRPWRVYQLPY